MHLSPAACFWFMLSRGGEDFSKEHLSSQPFTTTTTTGGRHGSRLARKSSGHRPSHEGGIRVIGTRSIRKTEDGRASSCSLSFLRLALVSTWPCAARRIQSQRRVARYLSFASHLLLVSFSRFGENPFSMQRHASNNTVDKRHRDDEEQS